MGTRYSGPHILAKAHVLGVPQTIGLRLGFDDRTGVRKSLLVEVDAMGVIGIDVDIDIEAIELALKAIPGVG